MTKARTLADLLDSSGDVKSSALDNATSSLSDLSVTATASELNTLDGVTATTAEINYLDGVTSNVQTQIDGISSEVVDDTTPSLGGDLSTNGNDINFGDNDKAQFGAGNDLKVFHDGSNSYINDTGTGDLVIRGNGLRLEDANTNYAIRVINGAEVDLRYNGSKKLETTSTGIDVTGTITTDGFDYRSGTNQTLIVGNSGSYAGGEYGRVMFKESNTELAKVQWNGTGNVFEITNVVNGPLSLRTNNTERLKINGDGSWGKAPAGTVLQVVQDVESNAQSYTGTGESTILSATITPKSSSSKILILCTTHINSIHGYRYAYGKLYRGSSNVFNGNSSGNRTPVTVGHTGNSDGHDRYVLHDQSFQVLDSPNTTSATTYYVKMGNSYYNTTVYNNRTSIDANSGYSQRGASSLILMEIAG